MSEKKNLTLKCLYEEIAGSSKEFEKQSKNDFRITTI